MPAAARPEPIRFVRNGAVRELSGLDPNMTVLEYLRQVERRTGTKEGCAEGDCGACTVVLGELVGRRLRYRAVNACLLLLPVLDGKQLIAVEDLAAPDGGLHPVQQALVDSHGSQCGFCTPGIVMSLFALYKAGGPPSRRAVDDALAGNLCRCTGYRPIVDAAAAMHGYGAADAFDADKRKTVRLLGAIRRTRCFAYAAGGKRFFAPVSVAELAPLVRRHGDAFLLAGGTDLGLEVTKRLRELDTVIYLGGVAELARIGRRNGCLELGAGAAYSDCMAAVAGQYPSFGELLRRLGSAQIRNLGTMGGNLATASPIGDTMPALIALDARVVLQKGERLRELPVESFFPGYRRTALQRGEFIARLRLPRPPPGHRFAAYKLSKRFDQDISAVCGAFSLMLRDGRVEDVRIGFGGMAAVPSRATACEAALRGMAWTGATIEGAVRALDGEFSPLSDMRASDGYRRLAAGNLLRKFWLETTGQAEAANLALYGRPA